MRIRIAAVSLSVLLAAGAIASAALADSGSTTSNCGRLTTPSGPVTVRIAPTSLWPPNHKMRTVTIGMTDPDNDGDVISLNVGTITNSEQGHEKGSTANTSPDAVVSQPNPKPGVDGTAVPDLSTTIQLRAERNGGDRDGRTYSVPVTCTTEEGTGTTTLTVHVPHDQGHRNR